MRPLRPDCIRERTPVSRVKAAQRLCGIAHRRVIPLGAGRLVAVGGTVEASAERNVAAAVASLRQFLFGVMVQRGPPPPVGAGAKRISQKAGERGQGQNSDKGSAIPGRIAG